MSIKTLFRNPLTFAATYGLVGAAFTATGAAMMGNDVSAECQSVAVGGLVVGLMTGAVSFMSAQAVKGSSSNCLKLVDEVLDLTLRVATVLTAPLLGEKIIGHTNSINNADTLCDEIIGFATHMGGALAVAGAVKGCVKLGLFSNAPTHTTEPVAADLNTDLLNLV